jgi:hypothetical protein
MKKMVLVFTLAAFALCGSAFAQDNHYTNNIGLYLTPGGYLDPGADDGTGSCGTVEPNTPFIAYVVLSEMTYNEVWGWEALFFPENMYFTGTEFYGQGFNAGTRENEVIVGLAEPLLASEGAVVVAELTFLISDFFHDLSQPSKVFIEGVYYSTIDPVQGPPAVLIAPGGPAIELHPALGAEPNEVSLPQLIINGDCDVVAVEGSSWGALKSLYR